MERDVAPTLAAAVSWTCTGDGIPAPSKISWAPARRATGVATTAIVVEPMGVSEEVWMICPVARLWSSWRKSTPSALRRSQTSCGIVNRVASVTGISAISSHCASQERPDGDEEVDEQGRQGHPHQHLEVFHELGEPLL